VPAKVFEVEPLGGFTVVTISAGEQKLRALMRGQPRIEVDSAVALSCDPRRMHFFRPDGQALAPAGQGV
jgi:multiple sugar transport system ATP-binding protein